LRSFKDVTEEKTEVHVSVEETVALEIEDKKGSKDILLDKGDAIAVGFYIFTSTLNKKEIEELCEMMKERVSA
jgi:hypothetical protein